MAAINDYGGMTYMAQDLTFGGVKKSGFGRHQWARGFACHVQREGRDWTIVFRSPLRTSFTQ